MKIYNIILCSSLIAICSCNYYTQKKILNQTTIINTQNVAVNINIPLIEKYSHKLLADILANATLNIINKPNVDSIRKYYARNNNETLQITTSWKTNHNQTIISAAINTTVINNNLPAPNKIYTQTTLNNKTLEIEHIVDLNNKKEMFRDIIIDKFLSDNDITQNIKPCYTTLIKPLNQFPISDEFILSEKNLTLIYNPQTLTSDNKIVIVEIPYHRINDLMIIDTRNTANLNTSEFNATIP